MDTVFQLTHHSPTRQLSFGGMSREFGTANSVSDVLRGACMAEHAPNRMRSTQKILRMQRDATAAWASAWLSIFVGSKQRP